MNNIIVSFFRRRKILPTIHEININRYLFRILDYFLTVTYVSIKQEIECKEKKQGGRETGCYAEKKTHIGKVVVSLQEVLQVYALPWDFETPVSNLKNKKSYLSSKLAVEFCVSAFAICSRGASFQIELIRNFIPPHYHHHHHHGALWKV